MKKRYLTKRQNDVYDFIKKFISRHGYSPTIRELCEGVNLSSTASVYNLLSKLEKYGYIRKNGHKFRSIEVLDENEYLKLDVINIPYLVFSKHLFDDMISNNNLVSVSSSFGLDSNCMFIEDTINGIIYVIRHKQLYEMNDIVLTIIDGKIKEELFVNAGSEIIGALLYTITKKSK